MATALGGADIDLCQTDPMAGFVSTISSWPKPITLGVHTFAVTLSTQPSNPSTMQIYRIGTDGTQTLLNQDYNNGWEYLGLVSNLPSAYVDSPSGQVNIDPVSGYAIQLYGNAVLNPGEAIRAQFTPL